MEPETKMPDETHDWEKTAERLRKRLDEGYPPAWMHDGEIGAELIGHVVGVKPAVPTQFGPAPVVTVATLGGTRLSLWLTHTVLKNEFVRQAPAVGELIAVRYEGEVRPESGGPAYEKYSLAVDRPDQADVDWNQIAVRYGVDRDREGTVPPSVDSPPEDYAPDPDADDIPF